MSEQLSLSLAKLEDFTNMMEQDDQRKKQELDSMKHLSSLQELELLKAELERQLVQEKERNRALRFKAGQIFMS